MPEVRLEDVAKIYKEKDKRSTSAIMDINLTIEQGDFIFLVGSRGAGKSTLLRLISGELTPDRGAVYLDELNLQKVSPQKLKESMGMVPQESGLKRTETILRNLSPPPKRKWFQRFTKGDGQQQENDTRAIKALGLVGMAGCEERYPLEYSIADCKRIELARAIQNSPPILLLDGMTERVDDDTVWDIVHLLMELNKRGTTILMVTNSSQIVNIMRKRVITMADGRIVGDVRKGKYGYIC